MRERRSGLRVGPSSRLASAVVEMFTRLRSYVSDAKFMRRVNGWLTVGWIVMVPVSWRLGWFHSVAYVSALSLWALVAGHLSTWQAARVEVHQDRDADVSEVLREVRELRKAHEDPDHR